MLLLVAGQAGNLDHCQLRPDVSLYLPQQALQARPCPRRQLPTLRTHRLRVMELHHDSLHTLLLLAQVHLGMGHLLFWDSLPLRDPAHRKRLEQFTQVESLHRDNSLQVRLHGHTLVSGYHESPAASHRRLQKLARSRLKD